MRQRRNPLANVFVVLLIGALAGITFLIVDNLDAPDTALSTPTVVPSLPPSLTLTPTPPQESLEQPTPTPLRGIVSEALISIPAAGIVEKPIVPVFIAGETWDVSELGNNVGHLQGTGWFDATGNVVLSGHVELADASRGIFAALHDLDGGERIVIDYRGQRREYIVRERRNVAPDDLTVLYPTDDDQLTLITCDSFDFFQNAYLERTVVVAERVS